MTLTVGRLTFGDEFTLTGVGQQKTSLSLSGNVMTTSSSAFTVEQQVMGLGEISGQIVPVVWSDNSRVDGFYRVSDVSTSVATLTGTVAQVPVSMTLEKVGTSADTQFESWLVGTTIANDHGLTGVPFWGVIGTAHTMFTDDISPSAGVRSSEDGSVFVYYADVGDTIRWSATPSAWYSGACEVTVNGSLVTGLTTTNTPLSWSLSNGYTKVAPGSSAAALAQVAVSVYDSGAWQSKEWTVYAGVNPAAAWDYVTVLANDAHLAGIRLESSATRMDLWLRRGSAFVTGVVSGSGTTHAVGRSTNEAATAFTGGIRATANDAAGNRYVAGATDTITSDLTQGKVTTSDPLRFFVGSALNGSGAAAVDTPDALAGQFIGYSSERVTPIPR